MKLTTTKKTAYLIFSGTILLLAILFRFYNLSGRAIFTEDHALFNIFAYKNIVYHERITVGPSIGGVWAVFPPTFYYLTTFLLKITNFSYYILQIMTGAANLLAILLMLVTFPKLFGKTTTLITTFLYSLSFFVISQAIVGTNPGVIPPLTVLLLASCIWYFRDQKIWALPIAVATISLMTHLHVTAFFLIPGLLFLPVLYLRRLNYKNLLVIFLSGLIFLFLGVRPHYLENKAFGNQNLEKVKTALIGGVGTGGTSKTQSFLNFVKATPDVNIDLLFPNPAGFKEETATPKSLHLAGILLSVTLFGFATYKSFTGLRKPTSISILGILFFSNYLFQALVPTYAIYTKPLRWLDATYFPLYFVLLGCFAVTIATKIKKGWLLPICFIVTTPFLVINIFKWAEDTNISDRTKIATVIKAARAVSLVATPEQNINLMHLGNVNLNPTWPFAFALWKETSNNKYLRTLLWNIDPARNEPFYIFSDKGDETLTNSEKLAKSFQDNPQSLVVNLQDGFLVEKIYNQSD